MQASTRRPLVLAARGAVLLAMAVGSVGYSLADKTVTISADGQTRTVHTFAGDVSSALRRAGVSVGAHDAVLPAPREALHDGSHIVVDRARPLLLSVDGTARTVWVTRSDPAAVLGLDLTGAYVSASRNRLVVRTPQQVRLTVGEVVSTVSTTAATVADLLASRGVALGPFDVVSTSLSAYPVTGAAVRVTQITHTQWLQRTPVAMPTLRVADAKLGVGRTQLAHGGRAGIDYRLWGIVREDGHVVLRKLLTETTVHAKAKVIRYGTRSPAVEAAAVTRSVKATVRAPATVTPKPVVQRAAPRRHPLNWAALARCESGGDPRLVDGAYYGLYQFSVGTWRSVGGRGRPSDASSAQQTYRAELLYAEQGRSPWPACGRYL